MRKESLRFKRICVGAQALFSKKDGFRYSQKSKRRGQTKRECKSSNKRGEESHHITSA